MTVTSPLPLIPLSVAATVVRIGDYVVHPERGLLLVNEISPWPGSEPSVQTQLLLTHPDDYLVFENEEPVAIYRAPSPEEWWTYLLLEHDISRWPNG